MTRVQQRSPGFLVLFLVVLIAGIVLSGPSTPRRSRVRRQNMKVRINATGDTIVMKFVRPNTDTKLEGYILGYGSSMFSKQFIQLPENGKPYETEFDAEPKYLIAVQPIPTNDVKKHCTGKVEMNKPLHLVIGSVTPTSVLLSWGTLLKTPYEGNIMNDCLEDGHYTVRYRERNRKWNYQTCPTSDTVIDKLKPNAVYEFGVQPSSKDRIGSWSKPVIHNISSGVVQEKVIRKIFKRPISPVKPLAQGPHFPFTPRHVLHNRTQGRLPLSRHITPKTTLAPTTTTKQEPLSTTGSPAPVTTKPPIGGGLPQSVIPLFHEVPSVPNFSLPLQISPPAVSAPVPKQNSGQSPNHDPHLLNLHQLPTQSKPRPQQPQTGSQPKPQSDQLRFKPVVQHEPYPDLELHATTHNPSPTHYQTSQPTPQVKPQPETRSTPKMQTKLKTQTDPQPLSQPQTHDQTSKPIPQVKPQSENKSTPKMQTKLKTQTDPQPLSQPQTHDQTSKPIPQVKPQSETRSTPKMQTKLKTQTDTQPQSQPQRHDQTSQPIPKVKPQSETRSTPKMQTKLKTQTDPQPQSQPQRHDQTSQPIPQAKPQSETRSTPKMQTKLKTQTDPQPQSQPQRHAQTSELIPQAKPQSESRSTPKMQTKLKTQRDPQPLSPRQTTSQPKPPNHPVTQLIQPTQLISRPGFEAHPKLPQPTTQHQPQRQQVQTIPYILPKQPAQSSTEPQIKTIKTQSESEVHFQTTSQPLQKTPRAPWPSTKEQFKVPKQPAQSATEPQIKTIQTQSESETTFRPFILHKTSREPWSTTKKQFKVQSTSEPRTSSSTSTTHPLLKRTSQPEAHSQTQPSQPAKSQKQPTKHSDQPQPLDRTQSQPQSPLWSDPLPQSKPASQAPPTTHYESQTKVNPAPVSKAEAQPGIEIQPRVTGHSGPIEVPPLQAVPTAPSPPEKGKPLPIPAPAAEKSDSNNLGTIIRKVEAPRSPTSSSAIPSGRNTTISRVRVPPHFPRNGVRTLSTSSHSSRTSGAHHRTNALPKPGAWPKEKPVLRQTIPVNKRPNLVGMPNDHDKPMDLKQGDKESILKPFPLVTSKPKHERRQQTTTITPSLNNSRFDVNENSSIFRPLPASDVDIMGKKRYVAPHVVYKTDKKPDEPCSITSSLSYFPDEEDGSDQNVTAAPRIPPTNLTVVTVEGCPSFVILDWQKTDNETKEYEVVSTAKGPNGEEVSILTTTNQTHTAVENLKPESSYEFKVTPKNELGTGPSSEPVSFNTESADPRVSENVSGKDAIWTQFPFKTDGYSECNGKQYIKRTWYRKFVGIQLCNSLRYKIYLSDSLNGKFYNIGDQSGYGEDHCQFVDSFLDGRTGTQLFAHQLPSRPGYFRALRQEPVSFGEIGGKSHVTYVGWYECGTPIPGKW
nr:target of Nesh-SH3 isoform X4 [Syngnathus scovelli]